ncbi:hypothetical protein EON67_04545, partial [archaeon]
MSAALGGGRDGEGVVVRGIYDEEADAEFEGVATFDTAAECKAWVAAHTRCTNPDYAQCKQIYTTLCDWQQVQHYLLHRLAEYRRRFPLRPAPADALAHNLFRDDVAIRRAITECLD